MIVTADLVLRPLEESDVDPLARLYADPRFSWFPYRRARTPAEADAFVTAAIAHWHTHSIGRWAVVGRATGALLGHCGVTTLSWPPRPAAWDLGFRLDASACGRGFGYQAGAAAIADAFARTAAASIVATAEVSHTACRALLGKLGLVEETVLPHPQHGTPHVVASLPRPGQDRRSEDAS